LRVEATLKNQLVEEGGEYEPEFFSLANPAFEDEIEDDLPLASESLLKHRTPADLEWERGRLRTLLEEMADISGPSSKMQVLLDTLDRRRDRRTGRIRQTVVFTRFYDTLKDIVARLLKSDPQMLIGTYAGREAGYYDPGRGEMIPVGREEVKERFLRGEIDVLVCTDAAAEGLNLQTAGLLVIRDLLETRARSAGEGALFWPVLREVASLVEERGQVLAGGLPVGVLRAVAGELLFPCPVPAAGDRTAVPVPRVLARAAVDAASRLADGLKVRKSELRVDTVLARLQREIEARWRQIRQTSYSL
jgi:hypothetical protein